MRRVFLTSLLLLVCANAFPAIVVESDDHTTGTGAATIPITGLSIPSGRLVVVMLYYSHGSRTITSVTDDQGTTYTEALTVYGGSYRGGIFYGVPSGTVTSVTGNLSGAQFGSDGIFVVSLSGTTNAVTGTPVGAETVGQTTHSSGETTPATASNIVIGMMRGTTGGYTLDSDFTQFDPNIATGNGGAGYFIQSSATAQAYDVTTSGTEGGVLMVAAFAGAAGSSIVPIIMQLH